MITIEQLARVTNLFNEIIKRLCNGTLDHVRVERALKDVIEDSS